MERPTPRLGVPVALLVAIPVAGLSACALLGRAPLEDPTPSREVTPEQRTAQVVLEADPPAELAREERRAEDRDAVPVLEAMQGAWNGPTSPYGADQTSGHDAFSALGALMGDQVGSSFGYGGLGLRGTGRGAGGTGGLGLGSLGTIGHGGPAPALPPATRWPGLPTEADASGEGYAHVEENDFVPTRDEAISTFAVDVDTASFTNVRRFLFDGMLPPPDAVRVEEMLNYFDHDYAAPSARERHPFLVHTETGECPWAPTHRLLQVGVQGRRLHPSDLPPRNLVFLVDVSGSMMDPRKLPLLVEGLGFLVDTLRAQDRVAIVAYAGQSGIVLPPTDGRNRAQIRAALSRLRAGGSTNGAGGIRQAYALAHRHFVRGGINRVILATDGDFNVGVTGDAELTALIEQERETGVFLTALGFGAGNYQDARMELLADHGNGNYHYIDDLDEAHRVLVRSASGTLWTIAQDVKIQVRFDPSRVRSYRLIGYENRALTTEEFDDDARDAGEIGAGHSVTALYEVETVGPGPLGAVRVRYQQPGGSPSTLLTRAVGDDGGRASRRLRFTSALAGFGMLLRHSEHRGDATLGSLRQLAASAVGSPDDDPRAEVLEMMDLAADQGLR
ncbi:MAG: VWA domain-containing protein [Sandaracinaceae bacterium]